MNALAPSVGPSPSNSPVQLLDLPMVLLLEVIHGAPWTTLRLTCRLFKQLVDADRQALSLRPRRNAAPHRQLPHLTTLLRRLPSLASLHVCTFEFTSLPFLTACPALTALTLSDTRHHSDTALPSLKSRRRFTFLTRNACPAQHLTSIGALSALTALRSLQVGHCTELTDVAPLMHCPHITALTLGMGVTSLRPLTALRALASLVASNPAICDLSPLLSAAALTHLHLTHTGAGDLSALSACTRLVSLTLDWACNVRSLGPLTTLGRSLTHLHLRGSPVVDLHPLSTCKSLSTLALSGCWAVTSIGPLSSLGPSLTSLDLSGSPAITDAFPIASLTALCHLDLVWTSQTTAAPLAACRCLRTLRVANCRIPADQLRMLTQAIPQLVVDHGPA